MKKILFTNSYDVSQEIKYIDQFFKLGLDLLHIRKPHHSIEKLRKYISLIDKKYHQQIVLHDHFKLIDEFDLKGIHISHENRHGFWFQHFTLKRIFAKHPSLNISYTANSVKECIKLAKKNVDYIFLGRLFSSHAISGLNPNFDIDEIIRINKTSSIALIALGGINDSTATRAINMGFKGLVLHKYIWENTDPIIAFNTILNVINKNDSLQEKQA